MEAEAFGAGLLELLLPELPEAAAAGVAPCALLARGLAAALLALFSGGRACCVSGCSVCDLRMNSMASSLASLTFSGGPLITSMGSLWLLRRRTFAKHCVFA